MYVYIKFHCEIKIYRFSCKNPNNFLLDFKILNYYIYFCGTHTINLNRDNQFIMDYSISSYSQLKKGLISMFF